MKTKDTVNLLRHKGYLGSIKCSVEDNCLYGEVLFINDLITYEADTPEQLKGAFEAAVDNYLAVCLKKGVEANRPFSGTFNVRLTSERHKQASIAAVNKGLSLNEFVNESIEHALSGETKVVNETHHHTHLHEINVASSGTIFDERHNLWQQGPSTLPQRKGH